MAVNVNTDRYGWSYGDGNPEDGVAEAQRYAPGSVCLVWADRQYIALAKTLGGRYYACYHSDSNVAISEALKGAGSGALPLPSATSVQLGSLDGAAAPRRTPVHVTTRVTTARLTRADRFLR